MTLRMKITVALVGTAAATLAVAVFAFLRITTSTIHEQQRQEMRRVQEDVARIAREAELAKDPLMLADYLESIVEARADLAWAKLNRAGVESRIEAKRAAGSGETTTRTISEQGNVIELGIWLDELKRQRDEARERALHSAVFIGLVSIPVAILLSIVFGARLSSRVRTLVNTIEAVGKGEFGRRTNIRGSDEIGRLGSHIDQMSKSLEELEAMKKTFVASVSHELRSPLAAIESAVRVILAKKEEGTEKDMLQRIQANASRLEHFVTNLLEMAKIERGKLDFHPRATDLKALLHDSVLFFEPRAREAGLDIKFSANGDIPAHMPLDADLITQVATNLLSNALKFTPKGGHVSVAAHKVSEAGKAWIEVGVQDSGVGIPAAAAARLFQPFERVPNSMKAKGTGLGLALCKRIIEMHEGTIGVSSVEGQGSRFYFRLPL